MRQNDSAYFLVDPKLFLARPGCCFRMVKCLMQLPFRQLILKVINAEIMEQPRDRRNSLVTIPVFAIFHAI